MKILVANWKLHPRNETEAVRLAKAEDAKSVVICPPFPFLRAVHKAVRRAEIGAQDIFWEEQGPYTGEVSAQILKSYGARYAVIGHSERRRLLGETDEMINKKVRASLEAGFKAILCVGEPLKVRRKGLTAAKRFVKSQLQKDLKNIYKLKAISHKLIVVYEPIWAIGTGRPDKAEDTAEMARFIRHQISDIRYQKSGHRHPNSDIRLPVLYGGSVTSKNIGRILEYNEIGGALVGGASLNALEFKKIIAAAHT